MEIWHNEDEYDVTQVDPEFNLPMIMVILLIVGIILW